MKLIIQIPCFDEEEQLPAALAELPRRLEGIDTVEWLIVDDGSSDRTIEVARAHGVDHIVRLTNHKGLATAFQAGLDACLKLAADIVVNTDAYNREAALQMATVSKFTYTLETIIQAGKMLVAVDHVPVGTNPKTRESRLFPSIWAYVRSNGIAIFRVYAMYEPLRVFLTAAGIVGLAALVIWARFAWFYVVEGEGAGH